MHTGNQMDVDAEFIPTDKENQPVFDSCLKRRKPEEIFKRSH